MDKFSEILEEYLIERDRQNNGYYNDRFIGESSRGRWHMDDLAKKMDELIHGATTND